MKKGSLVVETILIIIGIALTLFSILTPVQNNNMPQNQPAMQGEMQAPPQGAEGQQDMQTPPQGAEGQQDMQAPPQGAEGQQDMQAPPQGAEGQQDMQAPPQGGQDQPGAPAPEGMNMPKSAQPLQLGGIISVVLSLIVYLLIVYYAFAGYKVPHGNILRYLMFAYAISIVPKLGAGDSAGMVYALGLTSALIAYISGRLNKIHKNKILMLVVTILIVYVVTAEIIPLLTAGSIIEFNRAFAPLGLLVQWLVIMNTYIGRFKEHAEAGLEDKVIEQKIIDNILEDKKPE